VEPASSPDPPGRDPPQRRRGAAPGGRHPGPRRLRRRDQRQSLLATLAPTYGAEIALPTTAPQPISPAPTSGEPGKVRLTARQLLINQRIYQVALLRGRALAAWLNGA